MWRCHIRHYSIEDRLRVANVAEMVCRRFRDSMICDLYQGCSIPRVCALWSVANKAGSSASGLRPKAFQSLRDLGHAYPHNLALGHESLPIGNDSKLALAKSLANHSKLTPSHALTIQPACAKYILPQQIFKLAHHWTCRNQLPALSSRKVEFFLEVRSKRSNPAVLPRGGVRSGCAAREKKEGRSRPFATGCNPTVDKWWHFLKTAKRPEEYHRP